MATMCSGVGSGAAVSTARPPCSVLVLTTASCASSMLLDTRAAAACRKQPGSPLSSELSDTGMTKGKALVLVCKAPTAALLPSPSNPSSALHFLRQDPLSFFPPALAPCQAARFNARDRLRPYQGSGHLHFRTPAGPAITSLMSKKAFFTAVSRAGVLKAGWCPPCHRCVSPAGAPSPEQPGFTPGYEGADCRALALSSTCISYGVSHPRQAAALILPSFTRVQLGAALLGASPMHGNGRAVRVFNHLFQA